MPKNIDVLPEFKKGTLKLRSIPLFQYEGSLKEELDKGYSNEDALFHTQ